APVGDERLEAFRDSLTGRLAARADGGPRAVVLLCGAGPGTDPGAAALRRTRRLRGIAQAVAAGCPEPPRLYAVTRGARQVESADTIDLGQGALRGVVRVLAFEHPDLRATLLDADPADTELRDVA